MKKIASILVALICFSLCTLYTECVTLKITCRSKGKELELCKKDIEKWIKKTGNQHKVEVVTLPHSSNEVFALYQQWFSIKSFDIDILQMDVAWLGVFTDHLADLKRFYQGDEIDKDDYFDIIYRNMSNNNRLIALPWYTDCGIMYYRKDLLAKYAKSVPETWQELYDVALYIQNMERKDAKKKNRFYGFVFQGKAFECLTCNIVEIFDSFGGAIVKDGKISIDSPQCLEAVMFLIKCMKNISSRSVLNYNEEDTRGAFQSGNALFMINWPYAWSLLNNPATDVVGNVGVMSIPPSRNGGKTSGVLGGWFLAVSKYSKHGVYAADLVRFLTSKVRQRLRSKHSYLPTFKSLYMDPYVLDNNPFFSGLYESLQNAVARPSSAFGKNYAKASTEIFNAINTILLDSVESDIVKSDVERQLNRLGRKLDKILQKTLGGNPSKQKSLSWLTRIKKILGFGE
jgi:trehalose/maltose transport system substrate-binding protein